MKKKIVIGLVLLVIGALGTGAYTMHNMMERGFSTRTEPMPMEKALATSIREGAIPSRYRTIRNPVAATPEVIHDGMAHWADHCTACHANNGSGDTMYGKTMYPRPPDMRQKETQEMSDARAHGEQRLRAQWYGTRHGNGRQRHGQLHHGDHNRRKDSDRDGNR